MGESIRCLMVAIIALISIVEIEPSRLAAQGSSGGFEIPKSLSGVFGDTANSARGASNSSSPAMGFPQFTSGVNDQRAVPRAGGPTTEPTATRDSSWLTDRSAATTGRPSTEPYRASATGNDMRSALPNVQRSNQPRGAIATVGATQDPQSREAQLMALARENGANPGNPGAAMSSGNTRGFGSVPTGVRLPTQNTTTNSNPTFGSEFARGSVLSPQTSPNRTVYGPPTAQEANYDLSVFNANNTAATPTFGQNSMMTQSQQDMSLPTGYGRGASSGQQFNSGSGLGMPAADQRQAAPTMPSSWTYEKIAQLGLMFDIQPNDPRMTDKAFVNELYVAFREYQAKQQANQTALDQLANSATAASRWPTAGSESTNQTQFTFPQTANPTQQSNPMSASDPLWNDPRYANNGAITPSTQTPASSGGRRKQLYDSFGNQVDADGSILDQNGRPVDEATAYDLTYGKKLREDMASIANEQAEFERKKREQDTLSASDRALIDRSSNGFPRLGEDRIAMVTDQSGRLISDPNSRALVQRPGSEAIGGFGLGANRGPSVDQAGMGDAAKAIGRSNPYVNVFLLCSLVANAFLFVSLHRLWYHHRDLIASSRMASSGISAND